MQTSSANRCKLLSSIIEVEKELVKEYNENKKDQYCKELSNNRSEHIFNAEDVSIKGKEIRLESHKG